MKIKYPQHQRKKSFLIYFFLYAYSQMSVTAHSVKVKAADIFYLISHTNFIYQVGGKGLEMN